jgi:hypothetical protein
MITISTQDLGKIIQTFLTELPDANAYVHPSIVEYFFIDGKEVTLYASKTHGMDGSIWNVNILD